MDFLIIFLRDANYSFCRGFLLRSGRDPSYSTAVWVNYYMQQTMKITADSKATDVAKFTK